MAIAKADLWDQFVRRNTDPYSKCCVDVAREVMRLLDDLRGPQHINPSVLICEADKQIGAGGITGFMAGAVAQMVSLVHSRGEEFRRAWNLENGIKDPKAKGVVNPALLTIDTDPEVRS